MATEGGGVDTDVGSTPEDLPTNGDDSSTPGSDESAGGVEAESAFRVLGPHFNAIVTPFEGKAPYGTDVQYGDRYEAIQREIQKLTAASSKETSVDWKEVRRLSIELLTEESKNLSVACFLTVALFLQDGYAGCRDGLDIVRTLVADHWEGVFPPAKRTLRRANDLRWLIERLAPLVRDREPKPEEWQHLGPVAETALTLGELSRERLLDKDPGFGELITALKARAEEAPPVGRETVPEQSEAAAPVTGEQPTDTEIPEAPTPEASPAEPTPEKVLQAPHPPAAPVTIGEGASASSIRGHIEQMLKALRDSDPLSPVPYRILRILKWDDVPGPSTTGDTQIPPPRPNDLAPIPIMLGKGNWSGLLDKSEGLFKAGHIWLLDLQRYTTLSLEHLDPRGSESPAAAAVRNATRELLQRNSKLIDCTFAGGLPFASDETRAWLAEIAAEGGPRLSAARSLQTDGGSSGIDAADIERAVQLLRQKAKLSEGIEILQLGITSATGKRSRFRASLDAATAYLDARQEQWARRILETLQRESESLNFREWERDWAVELYQLLAICYGRLAATTAGEEKQSYATMFSKVQDTLSSMDMQAAAAVEESL